MKILSNKLFLIIILVVSFSVGISYLPRPQIDPVLLSDDIIFEDLSEELISVPEESSPDNKSSQTDNNKISDKISKDEEVGSQITENNTITFNVKVPSNTPSGDSVHMYLYGSDRSYEMERVDDFTYSVSFNGNDLKFIADERSDQIIRYRYSRNGKDFYTAEYLEPDENDYFWSQMGREVIYSPGLVRADIIERWRWFPSGSTEIIRNSSVEPFFEFNPRVNNEEFRSGQVLQDEYHHSYKPFFSATAKHMSDVGYNWVVIDPAWDWIVENPPKLKLLSYPQFPSYPDGETLKEHILAFKNAGLKVMLGPQVCCTNINTKGRTATWWHDYFNEVERFLVYHAKIAEDTGVSGMFMWMIEVTKDEPKNIQEIEKERWPKIWQSVRKEFSGEIGQGVWNGGTISDPSVIPDGDYITWGNDLDFFYYQVFNSPISSLDNPSRSDLQNGAGKILDGARSLYEKYGKPIIVQSGYSNIKMSWKGGEGVDPVETENTSNLSGEDLAKTINAYFKAIGLRPWIIGYNQFYYRHWEYPLASDRSIRGKPAEDIWGKWNGFIFGE